MIDSISIITKWNNIFDWRYADISDTKILSNITGPAVCILSARAWGFKGFIPGARHSYVVLLDKNVYKTIEITDIETIEVLGGNVIYAHYADKKKPQLIVSDRNPSSMWFGATPKIEAVYSYFNIDYKEYPFNHNNNLVNNNCNRFISYIVWKYGLDYDKYYIGFKKKAFWNKQRGHNNVCSYN